MTNKICDYSLLGMGEATRTHKTRREINKGLDWIEVLWVEFKWERLWNGARSGHRSAHEDEGTDRGSSKEAQYDYESSEA